MAGANARCARLLYIGDWDFEWQLRYTFKRSVFLPTGTRIA